MKWYLGQKLAQIEYFKRHPIEVQERLLLSLIKPNANTEWGRKYNFSKIKSSSQFASNVPIQTYESLSPYIKRMMLGEKNILWSGQVKWFAKSSGTTSDKSKFIPVTRRNIIDCHIRSSRDTMSLLMHNHPETPVFFGKSLIMGGALQSYDAYPKTTYGDISAIMTHHMPFYSRPFYTPDFETALLSEWEEKLERIAQIISKQDLIMLGGVPTWMIVLLRRVLQITGKSHILEVWPRLSAYIHGGVCFEPYREIFKQFIPKEDFIYLETYNASEGYFAVQEKREDEDMLLLLNNGVYYEFLPLAEVGKENPKTIPLSEVQTNVHYAIVVSTSGGLWRYVPGDTIQFKNTQPFKIKVTGRIQQFINTFGEEVIVSNTDQAISETCRMTNSQVREYTMGPIYFSEQGKGGHEWLVEFEKEPNDIDAFSKLLDLNLQKINSDYEAKRYKNIALNPIKLRKLAAGTFYNWLKSKGKYGGQHKVPRVANHRKYVEEILSSSNKQPVS